MEKTKRKILLVEDDASFGGILKSYLELNEYEVRWALNGKQALHMLGDPGFDLCLLDIMMPEMDGFSLAREIRKKSRRIPFIFLTAKSLKEDLLEGYRLGADDYITKPFDSELLIYKIEAVLRRNRDSKQASDKIQIGTYCLDPTDRKLFHGDSFRKLTPREAELLKILADNKNQVLPKKQALETIWGDDNYFASRSMDVYVAKLRKYLSLDQSLGIETLYGSGIRLIDKSGHKS